MKYTQEQVVEITEKYGPNAYFAYVNEATDYYDSCMRNYIGSVGYLKSFVNEPIEDILSDAHKFSLAATGLIYPPILCNQIDISFNKQLT